MTLAQLTLALSRLMEAHPEFNELTVEVFGGTWIQIDGRDVDLAVYLPGAPASTAISADINLDGAVYLP